MYSDEELQSAVNAGILAPEALEALRAHVSGLRATPLVDEENFRLISGFNDIFVSMAGLLVLGSIAALGYTFANMAVAALAVSVVAWLLAEPFTRKRRLALPSILLSLAFSGGIVVAVSRLLGAAGIVFINPETMLSNLYASVAAGGLAAWLHWRRFKVPIDVAMVVAGASWGFLWIVWTLLPADSVWQTLASFATGVAVFTVALRWDSQDPLRRTRKSDVAFWIHLLAAPQMIRPVFMLLGFPSIVTSASLWQVCGALTVYVLLAAISLLVDRRALMVSGLGYVLLAFGGLLAQQKASTTAYMITGLLIGAALLVLSAYWHRSRAFVMRYAPAALRERVTPLREVS